MICGEAKCFRQKSDHVTPSKGMNLIFCRIMSRHLNLKVRKFEIDRFTFRAMTREKPLEEWIPPPPPGCLCDWSVRKVTRPIKKLCNCVCTF